MPMQPGVGRSWRAASTRPRRSSRHGSRRSPTAPTRSSARSTPPRRHLRSSMARKEAIEAVRGGYELHYGAPQDPDVALLDGDRLYAERLEQLAGARDLE